MRARLSILSVLFLLAPLARAQPTVRIGTAVPAWVESVPVPVSVAQHESAIEDLLVDRQWLVEGSDASCFVHLAYRIRSSTGVERASELEVDVGSGETLEWHYVRRRRGDRTDELLRPSDVRLIQPEARLAEGVYDEERRALVFLEDIRAGDVIEYAFTRTQSYEVFDGRFVASQMLAANHPVRRLSFRARWPADRRIRARLYNVPERWIREQREDRLVLEARNVEPQPVPNDSPDWYSPLPEVELSEFADWSDVAAWGRTRYERAAAEALGSTVPIESFQSGDPLERIARALRFVQDEVRYLGLEMGTHAFTPHAPEEVARRRYGDCKDKSLLLVSILRSLGIAAHTALTSTVRGETVDERLPSPYAFNHVIVQALVGGEPLWLDATITMERGPVRDLPPLSVERALVLRENERALSEVPDRAPAQPLREVEERFVLDGDRADLDVVNVYRGAAAENARIDFQTSTLEERERDDTAEYVEQRLEVRQRAATEIEDDERENEVRVRSFYRVRHFWDHSARDVSPWLVLGHLDTPAVGRSRAPFALRFPDEVRHVVVVENGSGWNIPEGAVRSEAGPVSVSQSIAIEGSELTIDTRLSTSADHVAADQVEDYRASLEEVERAIEFELTHGRARAAPARDDGAELLVAGLCFGVPIAAVLGFAMVRVIGRAWRGRRKRAFKRKQRASTGEDPSRPIEADDLDAAKRERPAVCCGKAVQAVEWSSGRFGEERLAVRASTCPECGTRHRSFYRLRRSDA